MTADERIEYLEKQMKALEQGRQNVLNCPYCQSQNEPGEPFCCSTLSAAVMAICDRKDFQERRDLAEQIAEKASLN